MKSLVIPTNRPEKLPEFLEAWQKLNWDYIFIIEDRHTKTELSLPENCHHYSWKEIDECLGEHSWIISREDSAIRSFGLFIAYRYGCDHIFTVDDDCLPFSDNFCHTHMSNLTNLPKWTESVPGVMTRGMPYLNRGTLNNVKLSVGLWKGVPDYDALHFLTCGARELDLPKTRVMPSQQYFPICGMNMAMHRDFVPLSYFPLMGRDQPYRRFDDIWFGIIAKRIADHLGWLITCGEPYVIHTKASDPFVNLVKEAPGIQVNEHFWEVVDSVSLTQNTAKECMIEMGLSFQTHSDAYTKRLGVAMVEWALLF